MCMGRATSPCPKSTPWRMRRVVFKSGRQPHCKQMNEQSRERGEKQRKEEQKKKEGKDNL